MKRLITAALLWLAVACPVLAAGTLPFALQQQFSFVGCQSTTTPACGSPLAGGLLYFYQSGTTATRQDSFKDTGLTQPNSWPLVLDGNGRVPNFYLADGSVNVTLTDSSGVVQFSSATTGSLLVIGPSGGGGGGSSVDPNSLLSTGDMKFRPTAETLSGWVRMNGKTIGNSTSGATERANSDTQALYVYLWQTFSQPSSNTICAVTGGLGANALADFNASKALALFDTRGRLPAGLDGMGNSRANVMTDAVITNGGPTGSTGDSYGALGGSVTRLIQIANLPVHTPSGTVGITDPGHVHLEQIPIVGSGSSFSNGLNSPPTSQLFSSVNTFSATTGITATFTGNSIGSGTGYNITQPFMIGTWFQKL